MNITEAAKTLGVRPKELFDWLSRNGWIYKRANGATWLGYQDKCNQGRALHSEKHLAPRSVALHRTLRPPCRLGNFLGEAVFLLVAILAISNCALVCAAPLRLRVLFLVELLPASGELPAIVIRQNPTGCFTKSAAALTLTLPVSTAAVTSGGCRRWALQVLAGDEAEGIKRSAVRSYPQGKVMRLVTMLVLFVLDIFIAVNSIAYD